MGFARVLVFFFFVFFVGCAGEIHLTSLETAEKAGSFDGKESKDGGTTNNNENDTTMLAHSLSLGDHHGCLVHNKKIKCWGMGQSPFDNLTRNVATPTVQLNEIEAKQVSSGSLLFNCAINKDDNLICWKSGKTVYQRFGTSHKYITVANSSSSQNMCAITTLNELHCWYAYSLERSEEYKVIDPGTKFRSVSYGKDHACALTLQGNIRCWGMNYVGQLGDGTKDPQSRVVDVISSEKFSKLSLGGATSCAISDKKKLYCWGNNGTGQLGIGTAGVGEEKFYPTLVTTVENFKDISVGSNHTCAITEVGKLFCFGKNMNGQLGLGDTVNRTLPTLVLGNRFYKEIFASDTFTCALSTKHELFCWGAALMGQLGNNDFAFMDELKKVSQNNHYNSYSTGNFHMCGINTANKLSCWGHGAWGKLGNRQDGDKSTPQPILPEKYFNQVALQSYHGCAVSSENHVYCWGLSNDGRLGTGAPNNHDHPVRIKTDENHVYVAVGSGHSCAITDENKIQCWGDNDSGQLGDANLGVDKLIPVFIDSENRYLKVALGMSHTCAIDLNESIECWGSNIVGQLGNSNNSTSGVPVKVNSSEKFSDIALGYHFSCALTSNYSESPGSIYCWGHNLFGQLGTGDFDSRNTPTLLETQDKFIKIAARGDRICALNTEGELYCWGMSWKREDVVNQYTRPELIQSDEFFTNLDMGSMYICAKNTSNELHCIGNEYYGVMGNGTGFYTSPQLASF